MTFKREAVITSKVVKAKADSEEAAKYSDYFDFSEPLKRCSFSPSVGYGVVAKLKVSFVSVYLQMMKNVFDTLKRNFVYGNGPCCKLVGAAAEDSYKRLIKPSIETEFAALSKELADEEAINIFTENLRQLLLAAPLGQRRVMGVDPGFRTGCKIVCLDAQGNLLHHEAIFPHPPKNDRTLACKTDRADG